jgi:nicotinate phosphoribosyltransferase
VFRQFDGSLMAGDIVAVEDERAPGTPLLELLMQGGRRVKPSPPLSEIRDRTARNLEQLPPDLKRLDGHGDYPVRISEGLDELARQVDEREPNAHHA